MNAVGVYQWVSALLHDYLDRFGMNVPAGPLRAARELTFGIVWTGSVQLTNAARLLTQTPSQLEHAVKRLSEHLDGAPVYPARVAHPSRRSAAKPDGWGCDDRLL